MAVYCYPAYLTCMQSACWLNLQLESRQKKYQQPQICRWYHFNGTQWQGTRETPDEGEMGEWKSWFKTEHSKNYNGGIQSHHFMAKRWGVGGWKQLTIFFSSKITADSDCSHKIERHLLSGRKAMTNLDSVLKSRDVTFVDEGLYSQSYGFSSSHVWMWELNHKEGWTLRN